MKNNTIDLDGFMTKWMNEDSDAKRGVKQIIDFIEQKVEEYQVPPLMIADMHQTFANTIYGCFGESPVEEQGVYYADITPGTAFRYGVFEFIKPSNEATYVRPVGGGGYTHFTPTTICNLIADTQP